MDPPKDCLEEGYAWRSDGVRCNELQRVTFEAPGSTGAKDFSAIDVNGDLHLFYIENPGRPGVGGHETTFGHASSRDLVTWTQHPSIAPSAGPGAFNSTAVWAPQVFRVGEVWYMYYTGVQFDGLIADNRQRIGLLTSSDLLNWTPVDRRCDDVVGAGCIMTCQTTFIAWGTPLPWGSDCRDAFVLPVGDEWMMFVTVRLLDGRQAVAIARTRAQRLRE